MARKEEFSVGDLTVDRTLAVNGEVDMNGEVTINSVLDLGMGGVRVPVTGAGGGIAAGDLVCVTGYDATGGRLVVGKADADATVKGQRVAQFFAPDAIASGAGGYVYGCGVLTGLDTSSASAVGDPVYLSDTAGGWTLTAPGTAGDIIQQVGVVTVDHATTGAIAFFPFYSKPVTYVS